MPKTTRHIHRFTLTLAEGDALPREFRIWRSGENPTRNGYSVLFDEKAASMVMAAYEEHGTEVMIDLEHLSLEPPGPGHDPDARGWAKLAVRNGELWAVDVRWTADGERRLTQQTQRYVSPAFALDDESRPTRLFNIALVAMPGTDNLQALVAKEIPMRVLTLIAAVAAMTEAVRLTEAGISPTTVVKTLADGEGEAAGVDLKSLAEFLQISVDPASDPVGFIGALKAKLEEIGAKLSDAKPVTPPTEDAPPAEEMAAAKLMLRQIGCSTFVDGAMRLSEWRGIVSTHQTEIQKLADEKAAIEKTERHALVVRLQACGAETPATSGLNFGALVPRLAQEPIQALRERVQALELAAGTQGRGPIKGAPPPTDGQTVMVNGQAVELSAREVRICTEIKADLHTYASNKLAMQSTRKGAADSR